MKLRRHGAREFGFCWLDFFRGFEDWDGSFDCGGSESLGDGLFADAAAAAATSATAAASAGRDART